MKSLLLRFSINTTFLLVFCFASAQDFKGTAHYLSKTSVKISLDSTHANDAMQQQIQEAIRKQMEKEYTLTFDAVQSSYKEDEKLDKPQAASGGFTFVMSGNSGGITYKNIQEKSYAREAEVFGKPFLIKDQLESKPWRLENETKKIGAYTAYKASYTETYQTKNLSIGTKKDTMEVQEKNRTVIAWFTPDIPVNHGPGLYWGLPGLILEVNDGSTILICDRIVLNPKEDVKVEFPKKGKTVTQAEYEKMQDEKLKEMQEMYGGGMKGGNNIKIKIGN